MHSLTVDKLPHRRGRLSDVLWTFPLHRSSSGGVAEWLKAAVC